MTYVMYVLFGFCNMFDLCGMFYLDPVICYIIVIYVIMWHVFILNELSNIAYSDYIPVDAVTSDLTLVASLPGAPTMATDVAVLGCVGIEFYQQVGVTYYLFNAGNAMKIEDIF